MTSLLEQVRTNIASCTSSGRCSALICFNCRRICLVESPVLWLEWPGWLWSTSIIITMFFCYQCRPRLLTENFDKILKMDEYHEQFKAEVMAINGLFNSNVPVVMNGGRATVTIMTLRNGLELEHQKDIGFASLSLTVIPIVDATAVMPRTTSTYKVWSLIEGQVHCPPKEFL